MKPVVITRTTERPAKPMKPWEAFEFEVFDSAVLFTASTMRSRDTTGSRWNFDNPAAAYDKAAEVGKAAVYAVNGIGRSIVLDRSRREFWLDRWTTKCNSNIKERNMSEVHNPVFVISWGDKGLNAVDVVRVSTRLNAEAFLTNNLDPDKSAFIIERITDLEDPFFSGPRLVSMYNALAGDGEKVDRFATKDAGRSRVLRALVERHSSSPLVEPKMHTTNTIGDDELAKKAADTAAEVQPKAGKKAKATDGVNAVKKGPFESNATVTFLVEANPKRPGTNNHRNYEAMLGVMGRKKTCTVEQARQAGMTWGDLVFGKEKGHFSIA